MPELQDLVYIMKLHQNYYLIKLTQQFYKPCQLPAGFFIPHHQEALLKLNHQ